MKYNQFGQTGLRVSQLGLGCGGTGGLLIRGEYPQMVRTVARAIELGINYFDTAPLYGNGQSEVNTGAVLRELQADVLIGSKTRPGGDDVLHVGAAIIRSVEASLRRLGRSYIDLMQLHNHLAWQRSASKNEVGIDDLDEVVLAFEKLQQQGKIRFWGMNALGDSDVLHAAVARGRFQSIQILYNLLNPSAGLPVPGTFPYQDYRQLIQSAAQQRMGVIAFRTLAGGALSGTVTRHPVASPQIDFIASNPDYSADVAAAQRYRFLIDDGVVSNLTEAALRFVISEAGVSTALIGISDQEQLEQAIGYVERGPLPETALAQIRQMWC
jgi:aryl-alcohol dehydrogenase-like predicted oxidoreductase